MLEVRAAGLARMSPDRHDEHRAELVERRSMEIGCDGETAPAVTSAGAIPGAQERFLPRPGRQPTTCVWPNELSDRDEGLGLRDLCGPLRQAAILQSRKRHDVGCAGLRNITPPSTTRHRFHLRRIDGAQIAEAIRRRRSKPRRDRARAGGSGVGTGYGRANGSPSPKDRSGARSSATASARTRMFPDTRTGSRHRRAGHQGDPGGRARASSRRSR